LGDIWKQEACHHFWELGGSYELSTLVEYDKARDKERGYWRSETVSAVFQNWWMDTITPHCFGHIKLHESLVHFWFN